jgi:ABC-type branched-subunit amino acid transport system permease subunit
MTLGGKFATIKMMVYGAILVIVILRMPSGIVGPLRKLYHKIAKKRKT